MQCPYHAWTYGLNGCLRHAPRSEREPGFDPDDYGLLPVGVETWGPFVFVNRNRDAPPLETYLGRMPQILADAGIDFGRLRFHDRVGVGGGRELEGRGRELPRVLPLPDGAPRLLEGDRRRPRRVPPDVGRVVLQPDLTYARGRPSAATLPYNPDGEIAEAHFHWLWPTFTINVFPGRPNLGVLVLPARWPRPDDDASPTTSTREDVSEEEIASIQEFGSQVGLEDQGLVESIQRAADSGGLTEGRLMLSSEHLIQHFQRLVERALA